LKAPRHLSHPFVFKLAESGKQQNIIAYIGPVDDAILVDFKPKTPFETFH